MTRKHVSLVCVVNVCRLMMAVQFVMINILECELSYLKQWLGARHLHLLRFVEEETDKPATAPDSESALRPQPSVH